LLPIEVVNLNTVDDDGGAVLFVKLVSKPVVLDDSKVVIAFLEPDMFAEVVDSNKVISFIDVATYLSSVE